MNTALVTPEVSLRYRWIEHLLLERIAAGLEIMLDALWFAAAKVAIEAALRRDGFL